MPYVSDKQESFLRINKPGVAKKFDAHSRKKKAKKKRFKSDKELRDHIEKML